MLLNNLPGRGQQPIFSALRIYFAVGRTRQTSPGNTHHRGPATATPPLRRRPGHAPLPTSFWPRRLEARRVVLLILTQFCNFVTKFLLLILRLAEMLRGEQAWALLGTPPNYSAHPQGWGGAEGCQDMNSLLNCRQTRRGASSDTILLAEFFEWNDSRAPPARTQCEKETQTL